MAGVIGARISKKARLVFLGMLFVAIGIIVTLRVLATSSINIIYSYKNIDENYIVCQVEDTEYGILKVTNMDQDKELNIDLNIDSQTQGQMTPLTIRYQLTNGETAFKVWNTHEKYKVVRMSDISLDVSNATINNNGSIMSLAMNNEDGIINTIEYTDGTLIKAYQDTSEIFESIKLTKTGSTSVKVTTSNSKNDIIIELEKDTTPPQQVYVYKNNRGEVAVTVQSLSGIWDITDKSGNSLCKPTKFERYGTYIVQSLQSSFLVKNGVGVTTEIMVPTSTVSSNTMNLDISYEPDEIVVSATDDLVGLWKIVDITTEELLYKYESEPLTCDFAVKRELGVTGVRVYNMAGNYKDFIFDKEPPEILWAYRNRRQNTIVACIQDNDSGLKCVKDISGNEKFAFDNKENTATFEYYIEDQVDKLKIFDYEDNEVVLNFNSIKFDVENAYKNINGDKISIVAGIDDTDNQLTKLTYMDDTVIDTINDVNLDKAYELVHDGTVKVKLYDAKGDHIVIVLDYEEEDVPKINKIIMSDVNQNILIKAEDDESGIHKVTYLDNTLIAKFDKYTKMIDEVYKVRENTDSILIWDRVGNVVQANVGENIDEDGPELVDRIAFSGDGDSYTVTLRDVGSGLSSIKKTEEDILIYDFKNDGYPEVGTYKGKLSTDGEEIKIYDRLGNVTYAKVDARGPRVLSCKPLGDNPEDWVIVLIDKDSGLSKITYENGDLLCELPNSTTEERVEFSIVKGTRYILIHDQDGNFSRIDLDQSEPEVLDISPAIDVSDQEREFEIFSYAPKYNTNRWRVRAKDTGLGLKSIRIAPDGEDIAFFKGDTRGKETIDVVLPNTVTQIYIVDQGGTVSPPCKLDRTEGIEIVVDAKIGKSVSEGFVVVDDGVDDNNIIDVKLYNNNGEDIYINKDIHTGAIGGKEGIYIAGRTTARLIIGNEDVYIYGGYTGSGSRTTDASYIHYPGIRVAKDAKLIIEKLDEESTGTLYVYGNDYTTYGNGDGSAAAIGGCGVVEAGQNKRACGEDSGQIEIISGKVVATAGHNNEGYGTGAAIGGGGACAWNGTAVAGSGSKNNIIIHEGATVVTNTYGSKGVGAKIGDGGKYDKDNRRGGSGGYSVVSNREIPWVSVTHTPEELSTEVKIIVRARTNSGLKKISLDGEERFFEYYPTSEMVAEFIVRENRDYNIVVTDRDGLFNQVTHRIDNIINIVDEPEIENAPIIRVSKSQDDGIKINRDCTIIFENDEDIIINKGYKTNKIGMAGISIKEGVEVRLVQEGRGNVAIYGGFRGDISYPGIMVPERAKLEIQSVSDAKLYVFGYGRNVVEDNVIVGGSAAGIGGYGCATVSDDAKAQDCGSVKIVSGNVLAYGGIIEVANGTACGTGAGIGGGGAYSVMGMATAGKVKGNICDCAGNLVAVGGECKRAQGAGIGSGGAATVEGVNIKGQEVVVERNYIEIDKDTEIIQSSCNGYRITRDCKLTFKNSSDIIIGSTKNGCAGISVAKGVEATISIEGRGGISVYGGFSGTKTKDYGYYVTYPGIEVPKGANLTINNDSSQPLTVYGGGVDEIPVSAAAIGTRGIYTTGDWAKGHDVGYITINNGTLNVVPKHVVAFGKKGAVGAGIGSGGIFAPKEDATVTSGCLSKDNLNIADVATVIVKTKGTVKIGTGDILKGSKRIEGQESMYRTIDTIPPETTISRVDDGGYGYAKMKIAAKDMGSGLSRVVLEDGTIYRFEKFGQNVGSVCFAWSKNGVLNARVYDVAGNYNDIAYLMDGVKESLDAIDIMCDNSVLKNINEGEYINVLFRKQPYVVNMYVKINNQPERLVNRGSDEFNYKLQILDNCTVSARIEKVDTKETIWEEIKDVSNLVRVTTNAVLDKTSNSVKAEGYLRELYRENYVKKNIKRIGFKYSIVEGNGKVYDTSSSTLDEIIRDEVSMKYRLVLNKLKPSTTYKVQAYILNNNDEMIMGEERYFVTRAEGRGLTSRYYEVGNNIPKLIKQANGVSPTTGITTLSPIRNKYGDVVIGRVDKSKMEWIGEIVPTNSRSIWLKVESNKDLTMKIGSEELKFVKGESFANTKNIYLQGEKYPFKMWLCDDTVGEIDIKVYWLEDGEYQLIEKSQFYPKEYVKIESVLVDNQDKITYEIDTVTGKPINKKVLQRGIVVRKLDISNNVAILADGGVISLAAQADIEGNIILKQEGTILPIMDNVQLINYENGDVLLCDGSKMKLYRDVDVIGCLHVPNRNKSYDLCKYIHRIIGNTVVLSDETKLTLDKEVHLIDGNYILSLYRNKYDTKEYQELMNSYATTNRLVHEMITKDNTKLSVGETRLFEVLPVKILLSFEEDDVFTMKDPVLEIDGKLTKDEGGKVKDTLCLDLPTNIRDGYGNWYYMNSVQGDYSKKSEESNDITIDKMKNGNIKVTLDGYSKRFSKFSDSKDKNVMLNLLLSVSTSDNVTKEEAIERVKNMTVYTKVKVKEITIGNKQTKLDVQDAVLPIKIKK